MSTLYSPDSLPVSTASLPTPLFSEEAWVPDSLPKWDLSEELCQNPLLTPGSYIIAVEGVDGSGKSSLIKEILNLNPNRAEFKRSPGGTPMGEEIREIFKKSFDAPSGPLTEHTRWLLVEAARSALFEELEARRLNVLDRAIRGDSQKVLLLDRHVDSTRVYQPLLGVSATAITNLHQLYSNRISPDITIFVDVEPDVAIERIRTHRSVLENPLKGDYDYKGVDFFQEVINRYRRLVISNRQKYYVVDGSQPSEKLAEKLTPLIQAYLDNQTYY